MKIWVDADSCPKHVRDIVIRASIKNSIRAVFVANRETIFNTPRTVSMVIVDAEEGSADRYILDNIEAMDLVITHDIPLAAELVSKKAVVIDDRGNLHTPDNIRERLSVRNLMNNFRKAGIMTDGNKQFTGKEVKRFADLFNRELFKLL